MNDGDVTGIPMTTSNRAMKTIVTFDGWSLNRTTGELSRGGITHRLQDQPLQILEELLAAPGELVTRERLIKRLWPRGVVDFDTSLNTAVRKLRLALDDDPSEPRYIETLPRKGYRFIARVDAADAAPTVSPEYSSAPSIRRARRASIRSPLQWSLATLLVAGIAILGAWNFGRSSGNESSARDAANSVAVELYLAAKAQSEIPVTAGRGPRERALDLLAKSLAMDASFAPAYVARARIKLGLFVSNLDLSEANLEEVKRDLDTARRLSGNGLIGLDVRALYATHVDLDPQEGLRLTGLAPEDRDGQNARAGILRTIGRYRESSEIYERLLSLDPGNVRALRGKISNLTAEGRAAEAFEALEMLGEVAPTWANPWTNWWTTLTGGPTPSMAEMREQLRTFDEEGEGFFELWAHLTQMRREHRYEEVRELLADVPVESVRVPAFIGPMPGVGRMPVAALRGWNDLLLGDATTAAENGRRVLEFVAAQRETTWNGWYLVLLKAQAHIFLGDEAAAEAAVRDSLQVSLTSRHPEAYRNYLAAIILAWAGKQNQAVVLLESLANRVPPDFASVMIAGDPEVSVPLAGNARYGELQARLMSR